MWSLVNKITFLNLSELYVGIKDLTEIKEDASLSEEGTIVTNTGLEAKRPKSLGVFV